MPNHEVYKSLLGVVFVQVGIQNLSIHLSTFIIIVVYLAACTLVDIQVLFTCSIGVVYLATLQVGIQNLSICYIGVVYLAVYTYS